MWRGISPSHPDKVKHSDLGSHVHGRVDDTTSNALKRTKQVLLTGYPLSDEDDEARNEHHDPASGNGRDSSESARNQNLASRQPKAISSYPASQQVQKITLSEAWAVLGITDKGDNIERNDLKKLASLLTESYPENAAKYQEALRTILQDLESSTQVGIPAHSQGASSLQMESYRAARETRHVGAFRNPTSRESCRVETLPLGAPLLRNSPAIIKRPLTPGAASTSGDSKRPKHKGPFCDSSSESSDEEKPAPKQGRNRRLNLSLLNQRRASQNPSSFFGERVRAQSAQPRIKNELTPSRQQTPAIGGRNSIHRQSARRTAQPPQTDIGKSQPGQDGFESHVKNPPHEAPKSRKNTGSSHSLRQSTVASADRGASESLTEMHSRSRTSQKNATKTPKSKVDTEDAEKSQTTGLHRKVNIPGAPSKSVLSSSQGQMLAPDTRDKAQTQPSLQKNPQQYRTSAPSAARGSSQRSGSLPRSIPTAPRSKSPFERPVKGTFAQLESSSRLDGPQKKSKTMKGSADDDAHLEDNVQRTPTTTSVDAHQTSSSVRGNGRYAKFKAGMDSGEMDRDRILLLDEQKSGSSFLKEHPGRTLDWAETSPLISLLRKSNDAGEATNIPPKRSPGQHRTSKSEFQTVMEDLVPGYSESRSQQARKVQQAPRKASTADRTLKTTASSHQDAVPRPSTRVPDEHRVSIGAHLDQAPKQPPVYSGQKEQVSTTLLCKKADLDDDGGARVAEKPPVDISREEVGNDEASRTASRKEDIDPKISEPTFSKQKNGTLTNSDQVRAGKAERGLSSSGHRLPTLQALPGGEGHTQPSTIKIPTPPTTAHESTERPVLALRGLLPLNGTTAEPCFEYNISYKLWSAPTSENDSIGIEIASRMQTSIDDANHRAERLFQNLKQQYQAIFQVQFQVQSTKRSPIDDCTTLQGTFSRIDLPQRTSYLRVWVSRHYVSSHAAAVHPTPPPTPFLSKTLYTLRLHKLLPDPRHTTLSPSSRDSSPKLELAADTTMCPNIRMEDTEKEPAAEPGILRVYQRLPCTPLYTTLEAANYAARALQMDLSYGKGPLSQAEERWQEQNARELLAKVHALDPRMGGERGCWRSVFNEGRLGGDRFEVVVEEVAVCGPRNV